MRWWSMIAVTCVLACYAPHPPHGAPCGEGLACPSGQSCQGGVCTSGGAPADAPADTVALADALVDAALDAALDAPPDAFACPAGYQPITGQSSVYRTVLTQRTWLEAEQDCESDGPGTHLAVIDSVEEHQAVDALTGASIWFGLSDRVTEGTQLWVTGSPPAFVHTVGVPNAGGFDCAGIYMGEWAWGECTTLIEYVCECDGVAAEPDAY